MLIAYSMHLLPSSSSYNYPIHPSPTHCFPLSKGTLIFYLFMSVCLYVNPLSCMWSCTSLSQLGNPVLFVSDFTSDWLGMGVWYSSGQWDVRANLPGGYGVSFLHDEKWTHQKRWSNFFPWMLAGLDELLKLWQLATFCPSDELA